MSTDHPVDLELEELSSAPGLAPGRQALARFRRHRLAMVGLAIIALFVLMAVFAPLLATHDPKQLNLLDIRQSPSGSHWLGTDGTGYDVWSRLVYGSRVSLIVGFGAVALSITIGILVGLLSGYYGGIVDGALGRLIDTFQSMPAFLMAVVFVSLIGPNTKSIIGVIALLGWPATARLVRGQFLALRDAEFVVAARVIGASNRSIIFRHLLPNVLGPVSVAATFGVAGAILTEAGLSFLGLGVRPPAPTWGSMVSQARSADVLSNMQWVWVPPAAAIALVVLAVNFVGDGLRDAVDPESNA